MLTLPKVGYLGLQLEPAVDGCGLRVINEWRDSHGGSVCLPKGGFIRQVDGVCCESLPFKEAVTLLRKSQQRVIVLGKYQVVDSENVDPQQSRDCKPLMAARHASRSRGKGLASATSPARTATRNSPAPKTQRGDKHDSEDLVNMLGVEVERTKMMFLDSVKQVQERESKIVVLTKELSEVKSQTRSLDGQVMLLKYRLQKQSKHDKAISRDTTTSERDVDVQIWLGHWRKSQQVLNELRQRNSNIMLFENSTLIKDNDVVSDSVGKQDECSLIHEKFIKRLQLAGSKVLDTTTNNQSENCPELSGEPIAAAENQKVLSMHAPLLSNKVDVNSTSPGLLKQIFAGLAEESGARKNETIHVTVSSPCPRQESNVSIFAETPKESRSVASCSTAEICSAWKAWGARRYTEVASSVSVQPTNVVFSPASTSPVTFRDQMWRLRSENVKIRDEIAAFRQNLLVS